jgi:Kef-type K+ transport system membrane component KefB
LRGNVQLATYLSELFVKPFLATSGSESANSFLNLAIALVIIIVAAKLGGYISLRLKQPSVLGELIVGLLLGPTLLDMLNWRVFLYSSAINSEVLLSEIKALAEIGVLLLMFIAGLDLHLSDLAKSGKAASLAGTFGVILPLVLGFGTGVLYDFGTEEAIFIGLVLAATSVSISAQTLMELGKLRTRVGISLLGAAVFDDILVILGISVFFALSLGSGGSLGSVLLILVKMVLYLVAASAFGFYLLPRLTTIVDNLPVSKGLMAFVFITMLLFAWLAEVLGGMAPITGAFLAGLFFARSPLQHRIEQEISTVAYGLFVPIFFVSVGLEANLRVFTIGIAGLLVVLTLVAILGKVLGSGLGARLAGFNNRESLQMGVGMMSRGEVGLIVANQGITTGMIGVDIFSAIVGVVLITTLLTPILLRRLFAEGQSEQKFVQESN